MLRILPGCTTSHGYALLVHLYEEGKDRQISGRDIIHLAGTLILERFVQRSMLLLPSSLPRPHNGTYHALVLLQADGSALVASIDRQGILSVLPLVFTTHRGACTDLLLQDAHAWITRWAHRKNTTPRYMAAHTADVSQKLRNVVRDFVIHATTLMPHLTKVVSLKGGVPAWSRNGTWEQEPVLVLNPDTSRASAACSDSIIKGWEACFLRETMNHGTLTPEELVGYIIVPQAVPSDHNLSVCVHPERFTMAFLPTTRSMFAHNSTPSAHERIQASTRLQAHHPQTAALMASST